ncbi:hypothetical protein [Saccharopolyspora spinosa]|uniref:hypothetical protein n=1 Tax=Saccharopolyspora spinosa TaxID=60894 RepID=UPI00178C4DCA|nr:hypothetical protein [Saccharopolyspora spinosa]
MIDAGFDDGREGADFYARPIDDLWSLLAELSVPVFNPFTGHDEAHPSLGRREFRRWLRRMDLLHDLGGVGKVVGEVGPDLVGGRRLFPVIRLAEQLHDETADMEMFHGLAWLANQLDPVSSNISLSYLTDMIADIEGRADGHAPPPDVHRLVELVARARGFLGQVDGDPKRALEAIWNADRRWEWTKNRLTELEDTALDDDDEQMAEWAMRLLAGFEDARSVVVREPAESQARLNAVVLTPFMTRIAERFGGGWREVAAEIGLGDGTGLPADFEQSLENLAELYWETDPDLYEFYNALPGMRRLRLLIDVGFDDGREGAAFYKRKVDDLRTLAAELSGLVVNPQAGQQELRSTAEIRRWLGRMDLVHDLGGVGAVVGEIGADLVSGRRLLPVIRMAEELYGKRVGVERLRGLAWLANQFDPQSSNISQASLARMAAGFEGRADGHASPSDVVPTSTPGRLTIFGACWPNCRSRCSTLSPDTTRLIHPWGAESFVAGSGGWICCTILVVSARWSVRSARTWWVVGGCSRLYGWQSSCTTRRQTWKCSTVWRGWRTSLIPCRRTFRCRTSPT